jgi:hypothetical protein
VRQQDPELFAKVEREHRSGNLEQMRMQHVAKVNREIVEKDREHRITGKNIDINQLTKGTSPVRSVDSKSGGGIQKVTKQRSTDIKYEPVSKNAASRIKKMSKSETKARSESVVRSKESQVRSSERVTRTEERQKSTPEPRVEKTRNRDSKTTKVPEREKPKVSKPEKKESKTVSRQPTQSGKKYSAPQRKEPDRNYTSRPER